jgi:hypothetical protein
MAEFLNNLSEEQTQVALEITRKAKQMGIDPKLAVAVAYQESRLNPNTKNGASGEIGLMQVMPKTAEGMGFSVDDLRDPTKNIEIGLTYLKQGLEKFGDPVAAVAGYNAGHNHPYFSDPQKNALPASTKDYLRSVSSFGAFAEPEAAEGPEAVDAPPQPVETPASETDFMANKARIAADVMGAGAGAALSKGLDVAKNVGQTGAAIRNLPGALAAANPVAGGPAGPVGGPANSSGAKWLQNWGGISKEGFSGGVPDAAAQYNKMKPQGQIMQGLAKKGLITPQPVQPGVFTGGQLSISGQPPAPPTPPPPPAPPGALSQAAGAVKQGAGAVLRSPLASGAMGGLSMAESGQEAQKRLQAGDTTGAMIAGTGGLGGAMQMMPNPQMKVLGAMISAASPLTLYLRDNLKNQKPMPDPTEAELLAAQKPAFGMYPQMPRPPLRPRIPAPGTNLPPVESYR